MPVDHAERVEPFTTPQPRHHEVDGAEGDHADPAQGTRVHVADGPVGVVRESVHRLDRHDRAFEGRHAVEGERDDHHADDGIGTDLVPRAAEGEQAVDHATPAGHPQHDREHHAQGLSPVGQGGVEQVVRAGPDVDEDQRPEVDDRQPIRVDGPLGLLGHEVVHHAEETGRQEEAHGVMAVPPLGKSILHAGEGRVALG